MKGTALLALLGKPKGEPDGDEGSYDAKDGGDTASSFESEALAAAKDGDLEGMAKALIGYAKACMGKDEG